MTNLSKTTHFFCCNALTVSSGKWSVIFDVRTSNQCVFYDAGTSKQSKQLSALEISQKTGRLKIIFRTSFVNIFHVILLKLSFITGHASHATHFLSLSDQFASVFFSVFLRSFNPSRSRRTQSFYQKSVQNNFPEKITKITESFFSNLTSLQSAIFLKKTLLQLFLQEFCEVFQNFYFKEKERKKIIVLSNSSENRFVFLSIFSAVTSFSKALQQDT